MDSTVRSRPNHYETLGLKPTASGDEIARAFAREISVFRPRAFGGIAEVSIAFEILRDPVKRRAYDASLGLGPQPKSEPHPNPAPAARPAANGLPPLSPPPTTFIAAPPRRPAAPEPRHDASPAPKSQPQPRSEAQAKPGHNPHIGGDGVPHFAEEGRPGEHGSIEWKRTGIALVALVVAAGVFGGWAGWEAGNDVAPWQPERPAKAARPPTKPAPATAAPSAAPAPSVEEARPERSERPAFAGVRIERTPPPPPASAEEQPSAATESEPSLRQGDAIEQAVAESLPVAPVAEPSPVAPAAASLPLPNRVIARTIERIGYACGQVAATTAVEGGAPGVFKVTCTSGNSYQARPVRGRYRFRRWGGQ